MRKLIDRIWDYHMMQCNYCKQFDFLDIESSKEKFVERLEGSGWTINKHGAVKCGPCNWKDEERKDSK